MEILQPFDQQLSLIHDAHIHLPSLIASANQERSQKPQIDMAEMAIRTGVTSNKEKYRPYELIGSVAIINVKGALLHNYNWSSSYATGYSVIRNKAKSILNSLKAGDKEVKGVLVRYHSPGGSIFGLADTADLIKTLSDEIPVWSLCEDMNLSAAQWLASQATRRLGTQSSQQGSIGVVIPRLNYSKYLENAGIEVDYIFSGKHKVDGSPYLNMPKEVRDKYQSQIDKLRNSFAQAVSSGTGMTLEAVLNTEAEVFQADESLEMGLLDEVVSPNFIVEEFNEHLSKKNQTILSGEPKVMSTDNDDTQATQQADIQKAVANERARVTGIMGLEEAIGRSDIAAKLASQPSITLETAKEILSAIPVASEKPDEEQQTDAAQAALDAIQSETGASLKSGGVDEEKDSQAENINRLASSYTGG